MVDYIVRGQKGYLHVWIQRLLKDVIQLRCPDLFYDDMSRLDFMNAFYKWQ